MIIEMTENADELCLGCVYYPPNLPADAYPPDDWEQLQEKRCSFDFLPDDDDCKMTRKTSCSIVDMENLPR